MFHANLDLIGRTETTLIARYPPFCGAVILGEGRLCAEGARTHTEAVCVLSFGHIVAR